jgi:hypothetical protein
MALPQFLCRKDLTPLFNRFLDRLTDSLCIAPNQFPSEHTKNRATGRDLGLDKQGYNVIWVGHKGMLWYMVDNHILIFSSETTGTIATKLGWNGPWMAPFQNCVR